MDTNTTSVRRVVRAGAAYDLLVTVGFMTPWTARLTLDHLTNVQGWLGTGGRPPATEDVTTLLFASLMGSIVVVWSVLRIMRPSAELGLADTAARLLFASWMLVALSNGATELLVGFVVAELAWAAAQGWVVLTPRRTIVAA